MRLILDLLRRFYVAFGGFHVLPYMASNAVILASLIRGFASVPRGLEATRAEVDSFAVVARGLTRLSGTVAVVIGITEKITSLIARSLSLLRQCRLR